MMSELATVPAKQNVHELIAKVNDQRLSFDARLSSVGEVMKATAGRMMAALPKHVTPDRMMRVALNAIRKNPKLLDCNAASLFGAITEAATYGWEIGGILGHAYLVPYGQECVLIPGYKGLVDLCRRSGQISTISCEVVHEGDTFNYFLGDDPKINHKPNDSDRQRDKKPITYVYLVVRLRDGGVQRSVWSTARIEAHKEKYSQAWRRAEQNKKKDSFWHTAWDAAAKKTVIRDMIQRGLLPVSAEYRDVVDRGLKHDDDGSPVDYGTFDMLPDPTGIEGPIEGEVDAGERPQTSEGINEHLVTLARTEIAEAADEPAIDFCVHELLNGRSENEATVAAIRGLAEQRKAELQKPAKGKK
jgi:recombination protein RecT